jgi:hypothetical protein
MGTVVNAEYEADLGVLEIYDVGDIEASACAVRMLLHLLAS